MPAPDPSVLKLLRCPVTHSSMRIMVPDQLETVNRKISDGEAKDRKGRSISEEFESGLINEQESFAYSIRAGILQLIADEAIVLGDSQ
jgi:uncharacterized protein YbaR (Trm112 family)